jgi:hypothetical protein
MVLGQLRSKLSRNNLLIIYKLLNDLLFVEVIFFLSALIGEALLPGSITAHVGFSKILIFVGITVLAILYVGNKSDVSLSQAKTNKKTASLLLFVLILFIIASLIKISIYLTIILTLSILLVGYYIYKIFFNP